MRILVTGGLGLVGREVVASLIDGGHTVRVLDRAGRRDRSAMRLFARRVGRRAIVSSGAERAGMVTLHTGDLCSIADVGEAVRGVDAICHVGALIPPAADRRPVYADYVNRGGTHLLVEAAQACAPGVRFVYASSIAVFGDRRRSPVIHDDDVPNPNQDDAYAHQKLQAESLIRSSSLEWTIFRLTYIVSPHKLAMDPLMFEMPLDTPLEVCSAEDAGLALARAVSSDLLLGRTVNLAGGVACRTTYADYLDRMTEAFGLGRRLLPPEAFGPGPFHCGFMDTGHAQEALQFQHDTLEAYYQRVSHAMRFKRPLYRLLRPVIRSVLTRRSPYLRSPRSTKAVRDRSPVRFGSLAGGKRVYRTM